MHVWGNYGVSGSLEQVVVKLTEGEAPSILIGSTIIANDEENLTLLGVESVLDGGYFGLVRCDADGDKVGDFDGLLIVPEPATLSVPALAVPWILRRARRSSRATRRLRRKEGGR
jgi:hypothetical protein